MNKLAFAIASALALALSSHAYSFDKPEYQNVDPKIKEWFRNLRAPKSSIPCCDIADGHRTTWRGNSEGGYEVPIEGEWRKVPPDAVIISAGNPTGEAIVWYYLNTQTGVGPIIRCFVPGVEG